jgi:hypothetical protein
MNTTPLTHEEHIPHMNSQLGRVIIRVLYLLGFPVSRIGFLFNALRHHHKNEVVVKRLTTVAELEAAIAAEMATKDPEWREAFIRLAREGCIADTGKRRNGEIVWVATGRLPTDDQPSS